MTDDLIPPPKPPERPPSSPSEERRTIRYTHPETQPDDALHAINYASTLARRGLDHQLMYG